jgi:hypothetical protein
MHCDHNAGNDPLMLRSGISGLYCNKGIRQVLFH